jgi:hypothetical protein
LKENIDDTADANDIFWSLGINDLDDEIKEIVFIIWKINNLENEQM